MDTQEYEEQGRVETKKALEDLRKHCRRRDAEIWDKISNLHDSKRSGNDTLYVYSCTYAHTHTHTLTHSHTRFASFLAGKPHVSAQEQVDYEWYEGGADDSTSNSEEEISYRNDEASPSIPAHTSYRYVHMLFSIRASGNAFSIMTTQFA